MNDINNSFFKMMALSLLGSIFVFCAAIVIAHFLA